VLADNGISYGTKLKIKIDNLFQFELPLTPTFADAGERGAPAIYINSRGYLSMGRNADNLADRVNIRQGMPVSVTLATGVEAAGKMAGS
jgi:S-adenosylmethionine hydrolase